MKRFRTALAAALVFGPALGAHAVPLDLHTFAASPAGSVMVSLDGSSAQVTEDVAGTLFVLENPAVPLPGPGPAAIFGVQFQWELVVAPGNTDYFDFYAGDLSMPLFSGGGPEGAYGGAFYTMVLLPGPASTAPLLFDLFPNGVDFAGNQALGSRLMLSNVEIQPVTLDPVPEPGTLALLGTGLAGLAALRRRRVGRSAEGGLPHR